MGRRNGRINSKLIVGASHCWKPGDSPGFREYRTTTYAAVSSFAAWFES